ncbi:MAG: hypothetical protein ACRDL7_03680, partial [Gaiellaceae bacterium]
MLQLLWYFADHGHLLRGLLCCRINLPNCNLSLTLDRRKARESVRDRLRRNANHTNEVIATEKLWNSKEQKSSPAQLATYRNVEMSINSRHCATNMDKLPIKKMSATNASDDDKSESPQLSHELNFYSQSDDEDENLTRVPSYRGAGKRCTLKKRQSRKAQVHAAIIPKTPLVILTRGEPLPGNENNQSKNIVDKDRLEVECTCSTGRGVGWFSIGANSCQPSQVSSQLIPSSESSPSRTSPEWSRPASRSRSRTDSHLQSDQKRRLAREALLTDRKKKKMRDVSLQFESAENTSNIHGKAKLSGACTQAPFTCGKIGYKEEDHVGFGSDGIHHTLFIADILSFIEKHVEEVT